jgi:hypothetical protein
LDTGNVRFGKAAAIAGALTNGSEFDLLVFAFKIGNREREGGGRRFGIPER